MRRLEGRVVGGRYRIENVVSSGASTMIAEAVDTDLDRPVTVKVVRPELAISSRFRAAFERQVVVAQSLSHPNIAAVLDSGEVEVDGETTVFWVVEYLGGGSLRDLFDRGRRLEPSQALVVGLEACRALEAGHQKGIVHTEVTPSKLVFGTDGRLRVVDFAMAELLGAEAWAEPATVATHVARYASPEQALALDVDAKTDVYALSLCLVEAVTGKVPFAGDSTVSTLAARVGKLMPVTADMGSLASVLERGGRPDAADRWTAAEFGTAFVHAAETLPRPEPIPVLATSLFASSLAARQAAASAPAAGSAENALADEEATDDPALDDAAAGTPAPADAALDDAAMAAPAPEGVGVEGVGVDGPGLDAGSAADADADGPGLDAETDGTADADEIATAEDAGGDAPGDAAVGDAAIDPADRDGAIGPGLAAAAVAAGIAGSSGAEPGGSVDGGPESGAEGAGEAEGAGTPREPDGDAPAGTTGDGEPLVLLTDVSDDPTAVTDGAVVPSSPARDADETHTAEMPASVAAAAVAATTPATTELDVVDPTPSGIVYDEERSSRPWAKYILIALVVLVGVAALSLAAWFLLRTKSYEVPDLVGVDQSVAMEAIADNGWDVQTERERSDEVPEIDHVVRTEPAAGAQLDEGKTFLIHLSDGYEFRSLPELDGVAVDEAVATLEDLRLEADVLDAEYSETVPVDTVISWQVSDDPALVAGGQVLPDTVVEITPSLGPEPRPAPDLVGMTPADATAALEELQLVYAPAEDVFSSDIEKGLVATQAPAPTTPVERGGSVTVNISKGPEMVPIPDLAGMSYPDAQKALTDAGFVINSLLGTTEGTFVSILVGDNEVSAGDTFPKGTGVDLIFL